MEKCPKSTVESVRSKREKYTCFELCLSLHGGERGLDRVYGIPVSPSVSVMAQNI